MIKLTPKFNKIIIENGYFNIKEIPNNGICALKRYIFTISISCNIDWVGYSYRYCYHSLLEAQSAINEWSGKGYPPGNWIIRKGIDDIKNPNYEEIPF